MTTWHTVHFHRGTLALLGSLLCGAMGVRAITPEERDFFEARIRPVLVEHCYECHSSGSEELGGKLFLDTRGGVLAGGESGPVIVPGKPDSSLLIQAVRYGETAMPPDKPLPDAVVNDFVKWVTMGAPDPRAGESTRHIKPIDTEALWSFQPIRDVTLPVVGDVDWPLDPLDTFVLSRLEAEGLEPVGDARPEVLVRRLYYDLIGLPPAREQVEAFARRHAREGRRAVAVLVDRLLASPQFGVHWGRHWLDVARYGESNGDDGLGRNPTFPHAWRYRDYVIDAFNRDTPYDQFLTEQIAGDLLEASTVNERNRRLIATGFLALGAKPAAAMNQNFAMDVVDEQINVVSTAVMGLSVSCARCHDHKHDPIPSRDYYALAGIFASTETMWGRAADEGLTAPATPLHALLADSPGNPEDLTRPIVSFPDTYAAAVDALKPRVHERLDTAPEHLSLEKGAAIESNAVAVLSEGRIRADLASADYSVSFWFRNELGNRTRAITAYLVSRAPDGEKTLHGDHLGIGGTHENSNNGGRLFLWNGARADQTLVGSTIIAENTWHHVVLIRDGTRVVVYLNGHPEPEIAGTMDRETSVELRDLFIGARADRFAPLRGRVADVALFDRALTESEAQSLHEASGLPRGVRQLGFAMGVRDRPAPADCKINLDGDSKKLGEAVLRGILTACTTDGPSVIIDPKQSGRLQLARWLTSGRHPQTARVMINRIWLHLFGRGLVETPDDFGVYGQRPSHPDLLDHLADRFVAEAWSMKTMIRTIVLSRTYGLGSRGEARLMAADPDNRMIGRHSRRRLTAESMRDAMLAASGSLNLQPRRGSDIEDLDVLLNWPAGQASRLHKPSHHRSIYLCMLRDSPPDDLAAFDFPDGRTVSGERDATTLPTQALFLINSPFVVDQARRLADKLLAISGASRAARGRAAFAEILSRPPAPGELEQALAHLRDVESELGETCSPIERRHKAWMSLCHSLLATSEFRYID